MMFDDECLPCIGGGGLAGFVRGYALCEFRWPQDIVRQHGFCRGRISTLVPWPPTVSVFDRTPREYRCEVAQ